MNVKCQIAINEVVHTKPLSPVSVVPVVLYAFVVCVIPAAENREPLDFKDTELRMLVVSLKELTATKEVIQTLEQLLCDDASQLEEERSQVC